MTISKEQLQRLYVEEGLSQKETAERLGYESRQPVRTALEKYDIESRSNGGRPRDTPWKDEEKLRELYHDQRLSIREIAEQFKNCTPMAVQHQMEKLNIERRDPTHQRKRSASYIQHEDGYEAWKADNKTVFVHRLAAVAWFSLEAIENKSIHHESEIPWDNRESNVKPLTRAEHRRVHAK